MFLVSLTEKLNQPAPRKRFLRYELCVIVVEHDASGGRKPLKRALKPTRFLQNHSGFLFGNPLIDTLRAELYIFLPGRVFDCQERRKSGDGYRCALVTLKSRWKHFSRPAELSITLPVTCSVTVFALINPSLYDPLQLRWIHSRHRR